jgi:hypothetical protein
MASLRTFLDVLKPIPCFVSLAPAAMHPVGTCVEPGLHGIPQLLEAGGQQGR